MCHKFLEVKLSPQLNFIIGANGAGKSAILTALILAFGTKASATVCLSKLACFGQVANGMYRTAVLQWPTSLGVISREIPL